MALKRLVFLLPLLLLGCDSGFLLTDAVKQPRKVKGTADSQVMALQNQLSGQGVQVITEGEDYLVSIPSAILFPDQSPQLIVPYRVRGFRSWWRYVQWPGGRPEPWCSRRPPARGWPRRCVSFPVR